MRIFKFGRRVLVKENERALHLFRGEIRGLLRPGVHWLEDELDHLELERHDLSDPVFRSRYEQALFARLPKPAMAHLTVVRTGPTEVAIVERDGRIHEVLGPDSKLTVWTDAGPWSVEKIDFIESPELQPALYRRLGQARKLGMATVMTVNDGQVGLLYVDGAYERLLQPGLHVFWGAGPLRQHKLVDLKRRAVDVTGQEVLTRDRVTIRVNIAADYRVVDPVKATATVDDFAGALYRALQIALRKTLGAMTLDQILERKVTVDEGAADAVRAEMAAIGLEVFEITLKDLILPGEMRAILNRVVAAEKEAEANVIRRREETNATRSLLNTAKVMAENPVMLRLKELEALESIAGKVERLTVHNGADGLMNDLVRLREE